jgi:hypothetical protein
MSEHIDVMKNALADSRVAFVVSDYKCGREENLHIKGVYMDKDKALAGFFKVVADIVRAHAHQELSEHLKRHCGCEDCILSEHLKRHCGCDECVDFCKDELEITFSEYKAKLIQCAQRKVDDAVQALSMTTTDEGKREVNRCTAELEESRRYVDNSDLDTLHESWRGPSDETMITNLLNEVVGASRFFHFHVVDDDKGGLGYYRTTCEGHSGGWYYSTTSEVCMKQLTIE